MILFVLKRLGNQQFKALKSITHPNQQLIHQNIFKNVSLKIAPSKKTFSKLLPRKVYFRNCSLKKYILNIFLNIPASENEFSKFFLKSIFSNCSLKTPCSKNAFSKLLFKKKLISLIYYLSHQQEKKNHLKCH